MRPNGKWKKVLSCRGGSAFSHLFFVDDLVQLFFLGEGTVKNVLAVNRASKRFCQLSGQVVNRDKTKVFFSPNVHAGRRKRLAEKLGFQTTGNLGNYLGFPIKWFTKEFKCVLTLLL